MDIHPPGGKIHSIKEYLVHLSMVVLGILIALGLDGWRETRHERELVHRSIEGMRAEIKANAEMLRKSIKYYDEARPLVEKLIKSIKLYRDYAAKGVKPPPEPDDDHDLNIGVPPLTSAAWEAAIATQAIAHMDYPEAQRWARIYTEQNEMLLFDNQWHTMVGKITELNKVSADGTGTVEQLTSQLAIAEEMLGRIQMSQNAWGMLIKRYESVLEKSSGTKAK